MSLGATIKSFIVQSRRVWLILKKPSAMEYKTVAKVSAIGVLVLGALGFLIATIIREIDAFF